MIVLCNINSTLDNGCKHLPADTEANEVRVLRNWQDLKFEEFSFTQPPKKKVVQYTVKV